MRSELINEIFSVEAEAESLVSKARQEGRSLVATAQQEGESRLKEAEKQARKAGELELERAQAEADRHIESIRESLIHSGEDTEDLQECAQRIAEELVTRLCGSSVGDLKP